MESNLNINRNMHRIYNYYSLFIRRCSNFSYVSDIHVDFKRIIPRIQPMSKNLIILGDIGNPTHHNVSNFFKQVAGSHDKVFIVPGNSDYDCTSLYDRNKKEKYKPILENLCERNRIILLDNKTYDTDNLLIGGSTLWSRPLITDRLYEELKFNENLLNKISQHTLEYEHCVKWIENITKSCTKNNKKIIMATHFVPSFDMIEHKYKILSDVRTHWHASNLDELIRSPIKYWLAGHSHSQLVRMINGVYCGINAHDSYSRILQNTNPIVPIVLPEL